MNNADNWIPKSELKEKYEQLKRNYQVLVDRHIVDIKDLHTEDQYINEINKLHTRLYASKKSHRDSRTKLLNDIEYYRELYKSEKEEKFKAQRHEFPSDGLVYFNESIRNYFIQGLEMIKQKFLYETMPDSIKYETDEYGEFIREFNIKSNCYEWKERPIEESKKEWGTIINKMIKALKYKSKPIWDGSVSDKQMNVINEKIKEGIDLFIKYSDCLWF